MVAKGTMYLMMYKTQVKLIRYGLNAVEDDALLDLSHRRLAYLSEKGLPILSWKSLIPSNKGPKLSLCDYCLFGKHHRVSFKKTSKLKENVLDIVYSNVRGPMEVETLGGSKYFVTFIDDVS